MTTPATYPTPPNTAMAFARRFPDDASCADYLFQLRWPQGYTCPKCDSQRIYKVHDRPGMVQCQNHHKISVTVQNANGRAMTESAMHASNHRRHLSTRYRSREVPDRPREDVSLYMQRGGTVTRLPPAESEPEPSARPVCRSAPTAAHGDGNGWSFAAGRVL